MPTDEVNVAPILGVVGTTIDKFGQSHLVGYYSQHKLDKYNAPDYGRSCYVFVDKSIFGLDKRAPRFQLSNGFRFRRFQVTLDGKTIIDFEYKWPWYREISIRDDFGYISKDIIYGLTKILEYTHKDWLA